ncbi:AMP-binding protein [Haliangium sp.]|uniref:AMP-binding protein n=1 Tax=Haliangium sp. TaxID=2663208 RepID=UPI003D099E64
MVETRQRERFEPFHEPSIGHVITARAAGSTADKVHLSFHRKRGAAPRQWTFSQLAVDCLRLARALQNLGIRRQTPVLLSFTSDWQFILGFHACQLLAAIPIPIVPPFNRGQVAAKLRQISHILSESRATVLITDKALHSVMIGGLRDSFAGTIACFDELAEERDEVAPELPRPEDVAFIQYTSGSTGGRKGVPVTHGHLTANINGIGRALDIIPDEVGVSFLPVYHDMGLIGKVILTACHGNHLAQIPPLAFLRDPALWLWTVHEQRGAVCAAPPFAYELCTRRLDDADLEGLDLGSWRVAMAAADMIKPEVLQRFRDRFGPCRFADNAFLPVYGLAEATLAVTMPPPGSATVTLEVPGREPGQPARILVGVGQPLADHEVRICGPNGAPLPDGAEGEIAVRGPSVIPTYWNHAYDAPVRDGWLRTGDLGILTGDGLFVSGRIKDVIKHRGRSVQPAELEWIADEVPGARRGCSAAFNASTSDEQVILVVESRLTEAADQRRIGSDIRARARAELGIELHDVRVVPPYTIPKTSSGKVQRYLTRERYEAGRLVPSRGHRLLADATAILHFLRGRAALAWSRVRQARPTT